MKERIDSILVSKGYFQTRQKAKYAIENSCVYVNDKLIEKPSKVYEDDCKIEIKGEILPFVSRGGLKLDKAIKRFDINLHDKICIDIGASTGGFTDCMLQNGAKKIYAIDVGHGQLDEKIKFNDKVENLEGTNIKDINTDEFEKVDFISIDVSFISLTQVLDKAYKLLKNDGQIVVLIKPQFEAGNDNINKNGVVKDRKIHLKVIEKIMLYSDELSFEIINLDYSPVKGPAGNIEYLLCMKKTESKGTFNLFEIREKIKYTVENAYKNLK